jgi:hypothetical protein
LRAGPSQAYVTLSTYDAGTVFKLLGRNSAQTWLQLEAPDGRVGWMMTQFLRVNVVLLDIPVITAPPLPTARPTARPTVRPTATQEQAPQPQPTSAPVLPIETALPAPTQPPEPPPLPSPTKAPQPTSPPPREPTSPPRPEPTSPPR